MGVSILRKALIPRLNEGQIIWAIRIVVPLAVLVVILVLLGVFGYVSSENATVVGAIVALIGVLTTQIVNANIARSTQQHQQIVEANRMKHQQDLEDERAQDTALQMYLDQVSDPITYRALRKAAAGGYKRAVMQAKMKTLLLALDKRRKSILLLFLNEAKLIKKKQYLRKYDKRQRGWTYPILGLEGTDFSGTQLDNSIEIDFADLSGANLSKTSLKGAILRGVNLSNADLSDADLSGANLIEAELRDVIAEEEREGPRKELLKMDLSGANLRRADLKGADLSGADLSGANLRGAKNLKQEQLNKTSGNKKTQLPDDLDFPASWS